MPSLACPRPPALSILALLILAGLSGAAVAQEFPELVPDGATWKYLRGTAEPAPGPGGAPTIDWAALDFDDAAWATGPSGFGYGDSDDRTVLDDMRDAYGSVYLRHRFTVEDPDLVTGLLGGELQLVLSILFDDGFVAHLNGEEIARAGLAGDPPAFDAGASSHEADGFEDFPVLNAPSPLREGENVLAVQGHNTDLGSSDFSLAPVLRVRTAPPPPEFRVLIFTRTTGFRHSSISDGLTAFRELGEEHGFEVRHTENPGDFRLENLATFDAVVFLNTTGNVLDRSQEIEFEDYIRGGGGYLGVHSATDTEYDWAWYGRLVGVHFDRHPRIQEATIHVEDRTHASTMHLDETWIREDEWYNFRENPRERVHVLATLDESTYSGGTMGDDHPIAWCQDFDGGRSFYTAGGHTRESYSEPAFRQHLLGGLRFVAGFGGGCGDAPGPGAQLPGDANQDGNLDLGDPVWLLLTLFGGGREFPCGDGGPTHPANLALLDQDLDGTLGLSDAVSSLLYLFAGGPAHPGGTSCQPVSGCSEACR